MIIKQRKKATLFTKLTLSYFLIITLMALVLSVTIVAIASNYYSHHMQKLNSLILEQAANVVNNSVLTPINKAMIGLSLNNNYKVKLDDLLSGKALSKIGTLCSALTSIVSSSQGMLAGVHIYLKNEDFITSSTMGYMRNTTVNRRLWPDMCWFDEPLLLTDNSTYFTLRILKHHYTAAPIPVMTFVNPYPITMPFAQAKAMIAMDVPLAYLNNVLDNISGMDDRMIQLFDGKGGLILNRAAEYAAMTVNAMGYESNEACVQTEGEGVFVSLGSSHMLRSSAMLPNGWLIVSYVPVDTFFAVNRSISFYTVTITLCTVLFFLLISRTFARRFYAPVEKLLARAKQLLAKMEGGDIRKDEFAQVDAVLTEMETKLNTMSRDWEENLPTLKLAFMRSITEGEPISQQSFDKQLRYHARSMTDAQYRIMLLFLSPNDDDASAQPVNDSLIHYIEHQSTKDIAYIAYERSEDCICVLVLSSGEMTKSKMYGIINYARRLLSVDVIVAVGSSCYSPADIRQSFEHALQAYERTYFEEWNNLLIYEPLPEPAGMLRESLLKDLQTYADILDKGDRDELESHLQISMEHIANAQITDGAKHRFLSEYVIALKARMRKDDERFPSAQTNKNFSSISAFGAWLYQAGALLMSERSGESRTKEAVESVACYIQANLSQELSLTSLSEYTMLSNNYLSHIFKEHMGINLVDYVTKCRMTKAADMLTKTKLPVEQIARALGYNTPHYFSKRFREHYGLTPNQYRLR